MAKEKTPVTPDVSIKDAPVTQSAPLKAVHDKLIIARAEARSAGLAALADAIGDVIRLHIGR